MVAHLLGDFFLQPRKWVISKEKNKLRSSQLYLHTIVHILLALIWIWDLKLWYLALIVGVSHFLIDAGKILLQTEKNKRALFFIDQLLHIIVIAGIWYFIQSSHFQLQLTGKELFLITAVLFLTFPSSMFIKAIMSVYTANTEIIKKDSLENAGMYIGILERLLVFAFIAVQHWEGVGFLVAAKSVFRFSDLTQAKDRKLTEYILIGTLLSFGVGILVGITYSSIP